MQYFLFQPIYKARLWGGRKLEFFFKRNLKTDKLIGESWEIVDRHNDQSIIFNGKLAGLTLQQLLQNFGKAVMGPHWNSNLRFPLLIKWLDCNDRLSLQVHPPPSIAKQLQGEPKTENWYVVESKKGAGLLLGLKQSINSETFRKAALTDTLEPCLNRVEISQHDSIFVPSGRLHAIEGGCLLLEIQQNSDTTYRVHDWNRTDIDGKPRELHLDAAIQSIDFTDIQPIIKKYQPGYQILTETHPFCLKQVELNEGEKLFYPSHQEPKIVSIIKGSINILCSEGEDQLQAGANFLLPYEGSFSLEAQQNSLLLITDKFI